MDLERSNTLGKIIGISYTKHDDGSNTLEKTIRSSYTKHDDDDDDDDDEDENFASTRKDFLPSPESLHHTSARSTGGDGDGYESAEEHVFDISSVTKPTSLQRWKKAAIVLNAAWRFQDRSSPSIMNRKEQRKDARQRLHPNAHSIQAVNLSHKAQESMSTHNYDFKLEPEKLAHLVQECQTQVLLELGNVEGVMKMLRTDPETGISSDPMHMEARRKAYGSNTYTRQPQKPLRAFIFDACKDATLIILTLCAIISFVLGIKTEGIESGWYDAVSISSAVAIVVLVTSISNYKQSLQFSALNEEKRSIHVEVIRDGRRQAISIFEIVVGDIVLVQIGDQVPADGLFVDGHSLHIDQSSVTGEIEAIHVHHRAPFLLSGRKVDDGHGVMVVTAVGMMTEWGQVMASSINENAGEETPLQVRLRSVATLIGTVGLTVASSVLFLLLIFYFVGHTDGAADHLGKFKAGETSGTSVFNSVVEIFAIAVTIIVVAMPEGLPLAVTLSLAYAMKKMLADKALVRRLSACETMGCVTTICTDKTGTLTLNQMTVVKVWMGGVRVKDAPPEKEDSEGIHSDFYDVLMEGIVQNSNGSVFVDPKDCGKEPEVTGSATEKAILLWGLKMGMDYAMIKSRATRLHVEPFNSVKKRTAVAVRVKSSSGKVHVHWKGAAEIIVEECDTILSLDHNAEIPITSDERIQLMKRIEAMASQSLRCIALAYMQVDSSDVPMEEQNIAEWEIPTGPLTLLAIIGIKDPCRPEVRQAVEQCQAAGIKVRMVTGDNITTAKAIAAECGILRDADDIAIEGSEFRLYSDDVRKKKLPKIVVLGRSSPSDKLLMVTTLREMGEVVAVTGDGRNDAPAIQEADIGLSMAIQGTDVAKESSDIVIMDDNFASIVKVVRWGRSIHLNIQKFIQFHLTVNVAALSINFAAAMSLGDVPLTTAQLLWINLIMDTFGALALATEPPTNDLLEIPPIGRKEPLISNVMWRNIFFQASYQVTVLLLLQFKGMQIMGLTGIPNGARINRTVIFNAFVFCQIFNEVNARKLEDKNVFRGITTNRLFLGIVGTTTVLQIIIVEFLNEFASTVKLPWKYWVISMVIGFISWPLAFAAKYIPVPKNVVTTWQAAIY